VRELETLVDRDQSQIRRGWKVFQKCFFQESAFCFFFDPSFQLGAHCFVFPGFARHPNEQNATVFEQQNETDSIYPPQMKLSVKKITNADDPLLK